MQFTIKIYTTKTYLCVNSLIMMFHVQNESYSLIRYIILIVLIVLQGGSGEHKHGNREFEKLQKE